MAILQAPLTLTRAAVLVLGAAVMAQAGPGSVPGHGFPGAGTRGAAPGAARGYARTGYGPASRGVYGGYRGGAGLPVRALPAGCATYRFGGSPWFFGGGIWYRPWGFGYGAFYPPVGLALAMLPLGYLTYYYSGVPYYWYNDVYYVDAPSGGYLVADPPMSAPAAPPPREAASPASAPADALLIIPKEGQNEQKMMADRQNAQRYAMDESGFDPARSDPNDPGTPRARRAYFRAMKSYLEERGYSVK